MEIDLGKYEGHTPGPWKASPFCAIWSDKAKVAQVGGILGGIPTQADADAALIADAPALLDEIERLRVDLAEAVAALGELSHYAETSDDCQYGTLSTRLVRDIAAPVLAKHGGA